jgi:O-antigen ligase
VRLGARPLWPSLALGSAVLLLELAIAGAIGEPRLARLAVLLLAVGGLALVFAFPLGAAAGLLLLTASIFHADFFTYRYGSLDIHLPEVVFVALALAAVVAPRRQSWGGMAGAALATFLGVVVVCAWLGVQAGRATIADALNWTRPLAFYGTFWIVLRLFPDARSLRWLLIAGLACGAVTGVLATVLQVASSLDHTFQGTGGQQIYSQTTQAGLGGLKRIRQPGLAFSYMLFFWSLLAAMTARGAWRAVLWTLVGASAVDVVLSFNRNMWLGLLFGFSLMLIFSGVHLRQRFLVAMALGLTAVVLVFTVVGNSGQAGLEPIVARAASVLTPQQVGEESSLRDRGRETGRAWDAFQRHPLSGVGAGADFGVRFNHAQGDGRWVTTIQRFLHNQWLWLLLIGGIPALLAFAAFTGTVLAKAWDPRARTLSQVALGTGLAMLMLSAFVQPYLGVHEFCLATGLIAAVIVRANELQRAQSPAAR